ncbi:hypothetical protein BH23ACT10_BH23ACT10_09490 [soil metagenome]
MTARVLVSAWIGSTNLGDELVFAGLRRLLADRGVAVAAVTLDEHQTRADHEVATVGHRDIARLWSVLRTTDALVLGGGGLIQDATSSFNVPYHLARPFAADVRGVPWAGIGLGAGPLRGLAARGAVRFLRRAVAVTARHEAAADVLRSCGVGHVETATDLAFALPARRPATDDVITVSLRPWAGHFGSRLPVASGRLADTTPAWYIDQAAAALNKIGGATGLTIRFVALQTDRDAAFAEQIGERLHVAHEHVMPTLSTVVDEIGRGRIVVAMRYHAAIAAVLTGRPVVVVSYSLKTDRLGADLGPAATVIPWRRDALGELPSAIDTVLGDLADREAAVQQAAQQLTARGAVNGAALDRLLEVAVGAH